MLGLRDMIQRNLGRIVKNTENTFIEVESEEPLWRRTQFQPREVMLYIHVGERITEEESWFLHLAQRMFIIDWNARQAITQPAS